MKKTILAFFFVFISFNLSWSQEVTDYEKWELNALRAETVIETDRASIEALEKLRLQLVQWRTSFQQLQNENQDRIETIETQIESLGLKPESGKDPLEDRRVALDKQLAKLNEPIVRAQEAFNRADGMISEIDTLISQRKASEFLQLGPSILNPLLWGSSLGDVFKSFATLSKETSGVLSSTYFQDQFSDRLISVLLISIFSILLFIYSGSISNQLNTATKRFEKVIEFLSLCFKYLLRYLALYSLINLAQSLSIFGIRGDLIADNFYLWIGYFIFAFWLVERLQRSWQLSATNKLSVKNLRNFAIFSPLLLMAQDFGSDLARLQLLEQQSFSVLTSALTVLAGILLWRISVLLKSVISSTATLSSLQLKLLGFLRRILLGVAVISPLIAAIGYVNAGSAIALPMIKTLGLLALIVILQRLTFDVYAAILNKSEEEADALAPVLLGFIITISVLPFFAIIWGTRVSSLTELWIQFQDGIKIGDSRISPLDFLTFILLFTIGYMLTRVVQSALRGSILPKTNLDSGAQNALVAGLGYIGVFIAALVSISSTGLDLSSLAIVAGALSVGIGFGLQNIVSNFVSGVILLIERPISQGDWIEVSGKMGYVRNISVRSTRIETFDRTDVIIPNADLVSGVVTNWTRGNTIGRVIIPVGVAYGTDTKKVEKILRDIISKNEHVAKDPAPGVVFQGFGADSMDFEIRAILSDVNYMLSVKSDVNHEIVKRFNKEGIEIPFAQRDVWIRNPEVLKDV
ncbi:MAG: mechanosensitive ion channel protein MscS [Marinovum sp.]|nr:mechanosensitive ion channel protein MscS [Marinovum sp.]